MPRPVSRFGPLAGILALTVVFAVVAAVAWYAQVWRAPPDSSVGAELFPVTGLLIGGLVFALRPPWWVRVFALTSLALVAIAFNLVWFSSIDATNLHFTIRRIDGGRLASQYKQDHHWLIQRKRAHFVMHEELKGREVRFVKGFGLDRRTMLILNELSALVEMDRPAFPLPSARGLRSRYAHRIMSKDHSSYKGEEQSFRMVGITKGASEAEYFVAVNLDGVDFVIPDSVWESVARQQMLRPR